MLDRVQKIITCDINAEASSLWALNCRTYDERCPTKAPDAYTIMDCNGGLSVTTPSHSPTGLHIIGTFLSNLGILSPAFTRLTFPKPYPHEHSKLTCSANKTRAGSGNTKIRRDGDAAEPRKTTVPSQPRREASFVVLLRCPFLSSCACLSLEEPR